MLGLLFCFARGCCHRGHLPTHTHTHVNTRVWVLIFVHDNSVFAREFGTQATFLGGSVFGGSVGVLARACVCNANMTEYRWRHPLTNLLSCQRLSHFLVFLLGTKLSSLLFNRAPLTCAHVPDRFEPKFICTHHAACVPGPPRLHATCTSSRSVCFW